MEFNDKNLLICNCEKTMDLDAGALGKALGTDAPFIHNNLCRSQLDQYDKSLSGDSPLVVACTQEMPLFTEIATEQGKQDYVSFVNIREQAGWCKSGENPTAKIAALLKTSAYRSKPTRLKSFTSDGLCLVYGRDQAAFSAARILAEHLSVTLILDDASDLILPTVLDIPIFKGRITTVSGSFGDFTVTVDNYAAMQPSSRSGDDYILERNGAQSNCSLILDISGHDPLVTGHHHRDGYRKVDPKDTVAIMQAVLDLSGMVGEFEKPIYVDYEQEICAHSRSKKSGCSKCLDVCPAGAISDSGDYISIDAGICGGCGSCQAVCPTSAISYAFPTPNDLVGRAQLLIKSYLDAGGLKPVLLLHDSPFGSDLVGVMARFGNGLPGNVLPLAMHAVTAFGHIELAACLAAGACKIQILAPPRRGDELDGLKTEIALTDSIVSGLGFGDASRVELIIEEDPDKIENYLWNTEVIATPLRETFATIGTRREIGRTVFAKMGERSDLVDPILPLPAKAPYGQLLVDQDACTLCMACVSICPADAVRDTPDIPQLRFVESACVQCGLCAATCPEKAITLEPRLNISNTALQPITLYQEEPFLCIECGDPFATKSTIERISKQLAGKHGMFGTAQTARLIEMCADCRVISQANAEDNPMTHNTRPRVRTSDDYLEAEKKGLSVDDYLMDD